MGKVKSAICFVLITLIIAVLVGVCFVSFPCGEISYYNSFLSLADKSSELGGHLIGDTAYIGGGYSVVYYPEGVISVREYEETLQEKTGEAKTEYEGKYVAYKTGLYLEKETVCNGGTEVSEEFKAAFKKNLDILTERFEQLHVDGAGIEVADEYTVRAFIPYTSEAAGVAFQYFSYMGEFSLKYGSDENSATLLLPSKSGTKHDVGYYVKGASAESRNKTYYVAVEFTDEGREVVKNATSETGTMYFRVGESNVLSLSVSSEIDQQTLYISGSYNSETSAIVAAVINSSVKSGAEGDWELTLGEVTRLDAEFGDSALMYLYIAIGVLSAAMLVTFFIRYRRLGFVHLYCYLTFAVVMVILVWAIPGAYVGLDTLLAFVVTAALLSVSNAFTYESAKKEFENGKNIEYSVKSGYKKCSWALFDIHIALFAVGILTYLIAITELATTGLILALGTALSGVLSLVVGRFYWHIMMRLAKNGGKFCHFKKNLTLREADDE